MHEQPKNRDWVKNAAIIFLAVLLVLTFFSNTIMNRSLPEVATQDVTSGSIVARVRGTGTVTANTNSQVKMEKTRVIRSVLVKVGQQVEPGDVLFTLGEGSSEDIDAAEEKLANLQATYNRTAATMPEYSYYADRNRLEHLRQQYEDAQNAKDAAWTAAEKSATNVERKKNAEQALATAEKVKAVAEKAYLDALNQAGGTASKETLATLQQKEKNIINKLYNNSDPYHIEGFKWGDSTSQSNLINEDIYKNEYNDGNGYLSGEDAINRQISFVEHRISILSSPLTGEEVNGTSPMTYNITWKNDDGTVIDQTTVNKGEIPTHEDPIKANSEAGRIYTFKEWNPSIITATADATYQAVYSSEPAVYKITWENDDGSIIDETEVEYGMTPTHSDPEKVDPEGIIAYSFKEWVPAVTVATNDTTYQATFFENVIEDNQSANSASMASLDEDNNYNQAPNTGIDDATVKAAGDTNTKNGEETGATNPTGNNVTINNNGGTINYYESGTDTSGSGSSSSGTSGTTEPTVVEDEKDYELYWRKIQLAVLKAALEDYEDIEATINSIWNDSTLTALREAYEAAVLDVEKWSTAIEIITLDSGTPQSEAYKLAKSNYDYAEEQYLSAKQALEEKIQSNQNTIAGYNIDLANTWQQIEKAKQKLADLTGGEEAQILAKTSGVVQTIECAPGDTKQKDDILCTLELPNMGYNLSFSVTNDQAARLRPGDTATVSNFYWGTEVTATLNNIKVDPKNPQTNKLLTFDLSGNVTAGSELTLSVGQKSANYDIIIPSSSIRTDANGSFVLKVESKNSPLGNRYIARRVPVEVLASDDSNSAVSADLGFGDYVITTSSAPVKNGELVRLATS